MANEVPYLVHLKGATGRLRTEQYQGREHIVVPVVALMEGVIHAVNAPHSEFVPGDLLSKNAAQWNGRPIMLGHPTNGVTQISANDARVLETQCFGTIFNAKPSADRKKLLCEAWIDTKKAEQIGGAEVVKKLRANEMVEVSVGTFVHTLEEPGTHNGKAYKNKWATIAADHLAFLPQSVGACSIEMGCGAHRAAEGFRALSTIAVSEEDLKALDEHEYDDSYDKEKCECDGEGTCDYCKEHMVKRDAQSALARALRTFSRTMMRLLGGPGSGNFGHGGRPGERGGSSSEAGGGGDGEGGQASPGPKQKLTSTQAEVLSDALHTVNDTESDLSPAQSKAVKSALSKAQAAEERGEKVSFTKSERAAVKDALTKVKLELEEEGAPDSDDEDMQGHYASVKELLDSVGGDGGGDDSKSERATLAKRQKELIKQGDSAAAEELSRVNRRMKEIGGKVVTGAKGTTKAERERDAVAVKDIKDRLSRSYSGSARDQDRMKRVKKSVERLKGESERERVAKMTPEEKTADLKAKLDKFAKEYVAKHGAKRQLEAAEAEVLHQVMRDLQATTPEVVIRALASGDMTCKLMDSLLDQSVELVAQAQEILYPISDPDEEDDEEGEAEPHEKTEEEILAFQNLVRVSRDMLGAVCDMAYTALRMKTQPQNSAAPYYPSVRGYEQHKDKENAMNLEQRTEVIKALTSCDCSGFKAADVKLLEGATDEQLTQFKAATDARVKADGELKAAQAAQTKAEAEVVTLKTAAAAPQTEEDFLKTAPASIRSLVENEKARVAAERTSLNTVLETKQKVYGKEELEKRELVDLQRVAALIGADAEPVARSFVGRPVAVPRNAQKAEDFAAPDPYAAGIKTLQEREKTH